MSDVVKIWEVANLLRNDMVLITEWELFYHSLDLDVGYKMDLARAYNQNPNSFTLISAILERWVQRVGRRATIEALANVLVAMKHIATQEQLMMKFPNGRATLSFRDGLNNTSNQANGTRVATVVGSKECPVSKVILALKSKDTFSLFYDTWTDFARQLGAHQEEIRKLRGDLQLDKINLADVIQNLIIRWIARSGKEATLNSLINMLEMNEMKDCAEALQEAFPDFK